MSGLLTPFFPIPSHTVFGQPLDSFRQAAGAVAAQCSVHVFQAMNQVDHIPTREGSACGNAKMGAAGQRPSLINHASALSAQKRAASVIRQLHAGATGRAPCLPGQPCLAQGNVRRLSRQTEAAAIRRTHTKTLRAGNTPGAFLQQPAHRR